MRRSSICLLTVSLLLTLFQINDCFRLPNVTQSGQSGVVYENETLSESFLPPPAASSSTDNRTQMMMIVASEISNLPRFDPKNGGLMMSRQVVSTDATATDAAVTSESPFPSPSSSSSTTPQLDDHEDVTSLRNASNLQSNVLFDSCQFCPEARFLQHYFSKGCIAMQLQSECQPKFCPKFFECPAEKELPKDACLYEGKLYRFGESVPHRDPCQHCVCTNSTNGAYPMMSCAISECFNSWTALQPNCYRKYTEGKCCPEIVCVPENQSLSTCEHEGNVYNFGDYFSPEGDPCHNCLCDEHWNSSSGGGNSSKLLDTVCTRLECHFDFDRPENRGCVPVYSEKACCPMYYHCPPDESTKPKCKFGGNSYEVGEQVKVKQHEICLECSCLVPPEISCKHRACPTVPANCTAHYIEGECCPQFKCDTATVAEGHFDEEEGGEKSLPPAKEGDTGEERDSEVSNPNCPPVESCIEPCKVVQVDHHHHFAGENGADLEANEQSEGVRCARCQCLSPLQETLVPTENHINPATGAAICQGGLCGRTLSEEEEREQWGKSLRSPPAAATAAASRRLGRECPPVDCHFPCHIYRVTNGDCPRCLCLPKKSEQL